MPLLVLVTIATLLFGYGIYRYIKQMNLYFDRISFEQQHQKPMAKEILRNSIVMDEYQHDTPMMDHCNDGDADSAVEEYLTHPLAPSTSPRTAHETIARHRERASQLRSRFAPSNFSDLSSQSSIEEDAAIEEVTSEYILDRSIELLNLLTLDENGEVRCLVSPDSTPLSSSIELYRLLIGYGRLLSKLSITELNTFAPMICDAWIQTSGLQALTWIMKHGRQREEATPEEEEETAALVRIESTEVTQAAELILHTLVPFVWSQERYTISMDCRVRTSPFSSLIVSPSVVCCSLRRVMTGRPATARCLSLLITFRSP